MAERSVIVDDDDPLPRRSADAVDSARNSYEWGLASVLIGSTFLIMGPIALSFSVVLYNLLRGDHGLSLLELRLAQIGAIVCVVGAILICLFGLAYGIRGAARARPTRQPAALARAGILQGIGAVVIWLVVGIDLLFILT
jgi:hypothetical protein